MNFLPYEGKPVTRMAVQITDKHTFGKDSKDTWYLYDPDHADEAVYFKAHQEVKVGDWVVKLTEEDTYHCTDAVFRERNIVSE